MIARLSRHTLLLLVSNVGGAVLSLALAALLGRTLGAAGLGAYAVALAWVYPLSLAVEFGLGTLATRDVAQEPATADAMLRALARARLALGLPVMAALLALAPTLGGDAAGAAGLAVSAPMVVLLPFTSAFTALYKARGAMWPVPWLNIGMLAGQLALTVAVLDAGGGVVAALAINTLTSLAQLLAAWAIWRWRFRSRGAVPGAEEPALGPLLRRAWPFALAAVLAALQVRLAVLAVDALAGPGDAGLFAAANRLVEGARLVPNALFGALFPALAALAAQPVLLAATFRRAQIALLAFGAASVVVAAGLGEPLLALVYGDPFREAAPAFAVLALALAVSLPRGARTLLWYARGGEVRVNVANGLALAVQAALSLALVGRFGALGAAGALVAGEAVALALLWRITEDGTAKSAKTAKRGFI